VRATPLSAPQGHRQDTVKIPTFKIALFSGVLRHPDCLPRTYRRRSSGNKQAVLTTKAPPNISGFRFPESSIAIPARTARANNAPRRARPSRSAKIR
tara:strand:+ start:7398 stop:7688 length:291 start_codon:yes stop_codon:yes gene_type:complete